MLVSNFHFELPRELIATSPAEPRDSAKMLLISDNFKDLSVSDIPAFLKPGDVMIFNDTKVIPAKLFGKRVRSGNPSTPNIEATLHKQEDISSWKAFVKPARKIDAGDIFKISEEFYAVVIEKNEGEVKLKFNTSGNDLFLLLEKYGVPPLPPYIERLGKKPVDRDYSDYQTIYAKNKGAVAAPTAGLHFTERLLKNIDDTGCKREFVTLHVGAGTFLPVKAEDTKDHKMHSEFGIITEQTAEFINNAKKNGNKIIAVGTTSLRLLESAAGENGFIKPFQGDTDIFITPGYKFKIVDVLLTNFHLPESTLFMLVSAFTGLDKMQAAYKYAIANKYRFYSYGDACLLLNK